jgi:hypothetical protein
VVVDWRVFGGVGGGLTAPFDRGHTLSHHVGHYLGLIHVFAPEPAGCPTGDEGTECYSDDGDLVCDTEPAFEAHTGGVCLEQPVFACPSSGGTPARAAGNLMNYSDDTCMWGFTDEQARRMRCALTSYRGSGGGLTPLYENLGAYIFWDGFESGGSEYWSFTQTSEPSGEEKSGQAGQSAGEKGE